MRHRWQGLLELLWPSRSDSAASRKRRIALLQVCIAMAIFAAAGPEIFAAMEMTALLELLGALLFLTAFAAGAKLVALSVWRAICNILLPAPQVALVQSDASLPAKALASLYIAVHAAWGLALFFSGRVGFPNWPDE